MATIRDALTQRWQAGDIAGAQRYINDNNLSQDQIVGAFGNDLNASDWDYIQSKGLKAAATDSFGQLQNAWTAGDYGRAQNLINSNQWSGDDLKRLSGGQLSDTDLQYAQSKGVNPYQRTQTPLTMPASTTAPNLGMGDRSASQNLNAYNTQNPYLAQMGGVIAGQVNDNLMRNVMPQIRGGAIAAGGMGSARQGVLEANALKDANKELSNSLASMYYGDYNNAMNRNLQRYQTDVGYDLGAGQLALGNKTADNTYNLGLGNLALGNRQADQSYDLGRSQLANQATQNQNTLNLGMGQLALGNRQADNTYSLGQQQLSNAMSIAQLQDKLGRYQSDNSLEGQRVGAGATMSAANAAAGASAANSANNFQLGMRAADLAEQNFALNALLQMYNMGNNQGQSLYNVGNTQQNAPSNTMQQFNNTITPYSGLGQTTTSGGGTTGLLGGALAGAQLGRMAGGTGNSTATTLNPTTQANSYFGSSGADVGWAGYW